ncbi:MAG: WYL domain-containing protein [Microbacterium sp.]|uniref:helix-turn-helix transcriptional regulator n=1 Tax=Microbacterium sp. TaxID=51671 RepID=UPI0039E2EBB8
MPTKITPQERLLSLIVALMASGRGLTKEQVLSTVSGYREAREEGRSQDALERMFERDKEELRTLGVPLHTVGEQADPDDLREARYRIPKTEYVLPEDLTFTPAEVAVLNLAGAVWSEESLSSDAQSALRKIRALGLDVEEPIIGFAPRISPRDPAFPALRRANEDAKVVRFTYVKPGDDTPRLRTVAPLAVFEFEGRWHVYGIDLDLDGERTFLLSRIVGQVEATRQSFDAARREGAGAHALAELAKVAERNEAIVDVEPGTEAALRLRRRGAAEGSTLRLHYVDAHVLADELASYGPEVRVVAPDDLRRQVVARLERVLALHGGRPSGGEPLDVAPGGVPKAGAA